MFNLTPGRRFCLEQLEETEMTGREISKEAFEAGLQRRNNAEWADKYLLPLRQAKFISHTGKRRDVSQVYRINPSGRKLLAGKAAPAAETDPKEIKLTEGRRYCLQSLCEGAKTGREISASARKERVNKRDNAEWADSYLPWLRKQGFVEYTGARRDSAKVNQITERGRKLLAV